MPAFLTGKTQTLIIDMLSKHGKLSVGELCELTGKNRNAIRNAVYALRKVKMLHIAGYTLDNVKREGKIWALGDKPDVARPDFSGLIRRAKVRKAQIAYETRKRVQRKLNKHGPSPWAGLLP
jgi:DNA-binding transcriptional ArsR family regulator